MSFMGTFGRFPEIIDCVSLWQVPAHISSRIHLLCDYAVIWVSAAVCGGNCLEKLLPECSAALITWKTNWQWNEMILLRLVLMLVQVLLEMQSFLSIIIQIPDSNLHNPEMEEEKNSFLLSFLGLK